MGIAHTKTLAKPRDKRQDKPQNKPQSNQAAVALIDALGGTKRLALALGVLPTAVSNYRKIGIALKQYRAIAQLCAQAQLAVPDEAFAGKTAGKKSPTPIPQTGLAGLRQKLYGALDFHSLGTHIAPDVIQPAEPFMRLMSVAQRDKIWRMGDEKGHSTECLLPDYTIAVAREYLAQQGDTPKPQCFWYDGARFQRDGADPLNPQNDELGFEYFASKDPHKDELALLGNILRLLHSAGVRDFQLHINDIGLLEALLLSYGVEEYWRVHLRIALRGRQLEGFFNQRESETRTNAPLPKALLAAAEPTADRYQAKPKLSAEVLEVIRDYCALSGNATQTADALSRLRPPKQAPFTQARKEFLARQDALLNLGVAPEHLRFAPQMGYHERNYYTGLVFSMTRTDTQGVLARGGRYDRLLKMLRSKKEITALGGAVRLHTLQESSAL